MKHLLLIIGFLAGVVSYSFSQGNRGEKIEALKIAFITEKLQLTTNEAKQFWPVYNSYEKEIQELRVSGRGGDVLENEEKLLAIRKKYKPSFEKILGPTKMNQLFQVEKDFRNLLIKRLRNKQGKGGNL